MNKNEFLSRLEQGLQSLQTQERSEILLEYAQHIDQKVQDGFKEEEVINDFGDIDELLKELLSDPNYKQRSDNTEYIKQNVYGLGRFLQTTIDGFLGMNRKEVFNILGKFILLVIVFCFVQFGLEIFSSLICSLVFSPFSLPFHYEITALLNFFLDILSLGVFIYVLYYGIKKYVFPFAPKKPLQDEGHYETQRNYQTAVRIPKKQTSSKADLRPRDDTLINAIVVIFKVIMVVVFLLPIATSFLAFLTALLFFIYFSIIGLPCIGITLIILGGALIQLSLILFISKLLFSKEASVDPSESSQETDIPSQEVNHEN